MTKLINAMYVKQVCEFLDVHYSERERVANERDEQEGCWLSVCSLIYKEYKECIKLVESCGGTCTRSEGGFHTVSLNGVTVTAARGCK